MFFSIAKLDCENNDNPRPVRIARENPSSNQRVDIASEKAKYSNVVHQNTTTQCDIREWKWKWTAISLDSFEKLKMADKEVCWLQFLKVCHFSSKHPCQASKPRFFSLSISKFCFFAGDGGRSWRCTACLKWWTDLPSNLDFLYCINLLPRRRFKRGVGAHIQNVQSTFSVASLSLEGSPNWRYGIKFCFWINCN